MSGGGTCVSSCTSVAGGKGPQPAARQRLHHTPARQSVRRLHARVAGTCLGPCTILMTIAGLRRLHCQEQAGCAVQTVCVWSHLCCRARVFMGEACSPKPSQAAECCRVAAGFGATAERAFLAKERRALSSLGNRGAPRHARFGGMFVRRHRDEARSTHLRNNPSKSSLGSLPTPALRSRSQVSLRGDQKRDKAEAAAHACSEVQTGR